MSTADVAARVESFVSASVVVETEEDIFRMNATKNGLSIIFSVEEPEELRGLSITKTDGEVTAEYEEMAVVFPAEKLPSAAPFLLFCEALETLQTPNAFSVKCRRNDVSATAERFSAEFDPETAALQTLEFPAEQVRFSFENVVFSEEK